VEKPNRGIFERAYKGRPQDLIAYLVGEIAKRKAAAKA
jgi:hypothetical protein